MAKYRSTLQFALNQFEKIPSILSFMFHHYVILRNKSSYFSPVAAGLVTKFVSLKVLWYIDRGAFPLQCRAYV